MYSDSMYNSSIVLVIMYSDSMYNSSIILVIICDWLWENPPVTHKDNYLEKRN